MSDLNTIFEDLASLLVVRGEGLIGQRLMESASRLRVVILVSHSSFASKFRGDLISLCFLAIACSVCLSRVLNCLISSALERYAKATSLEANGLMRIDHSSHGRQQWRCPVTDLHSWNIVTSPGYPRTSSYRIPRRGLRASLHH